MKKIYINENFLTNVLNGRLLPQFLFKLVKTHTTSLGENEAFPTSDEYPFDYILLKERFNEVCDAIESVGIESLDEDYLMSELSSLVKRCKDLEKPIRDTLEKICENTVNRLFAIPEETVNMHFKLVDKIKFKKSVRLRPESNGDVKYTFKDVADIDLSNKSIAKRRFINSLIQGASYTYSNIEDFYIEDLSKVNQELPKLYDKIRVINDYLLFTKKEEMSDDKPMQGSYVETHIGMHNERTTLKVQGMIFPLLLQESIRGLFELFSTHGLPNDLEKAKYIIKKADFVLAEPWDLRFGVRLWQMIFGSVEDTNMIPYMFTSLVKLPTDEFNLSVKEILSNTEKGNEILDSLKKDAEYDNGYQQFKNRINARNIDRSLIKDSYFSGAETNGYELGSETDDGDIIEEDGVEESAYQAFGVKTNDVETWYRGICGTYDELKTKHQIWLADEAEYAAEYASECQDGHLYEFDIDMSKLNLYDWYEESDSYFDPYDGFSKEEIIELMNEGYNGYTFALDEATVLVLFDISLITDIREIPLNEFITESSEFNQNNNDFNDILSKATIDNIDFIEGDVSEEDGVEASVYQSFGLKNNCAETWYRGVCGTHNKSELDKYIPIQENRYTKKNLRLITENWAKDKRRIISRVVDILKNNIIGISTYDAYKLEKDIEQTYFHGTMAGDGKIRKYEPMVANILTKELGYPNNPENSKETNFLKDALIYMWNFQIRQGVKPHAVCSFEKGAVMDDFETIVSKYKPLLDELEVKGEDVKFIGGSDYEIIPIEDFKTAKQYGDYSNPNLPLCYTQGEGTWDMYTNNGANKVYLCLNKETWENWGIGERPENSDETPYDEYGLSMIWVFISRSGNIAYSNTRWNHNMEARIPNGGYGGKDVDHSFDGPSLERVLNMPFEEAFGVKLGEGFDYTKYVNKKIEKINNQLSSISDEFDDNECALFTTDFDNIKMVTVENKCNFIKLDEGKVTLLSPDVWFDYALAKKEMNIVSPRILSVVRAKEKYNIIDIDGNLLLPNNMWCDQIKNDRLNNGANGINVYVLKINDRYNCLGPDGNLLFDEWVVKIHPANNLRKVFFIDKNDGSIEVFDNDINSFRSLNEIIENHLIRGEEMPSAVTNNIKFNDYDGEVKFCGYKNLISNNGTILNKIWFTDIVKTNKNVSIVMLGKVFNLMDNNTGEIIYKRSLNDWFTRIIPFSYDNNHFYVEYNNKINVIDINGNLLFQSDNLENWADDFQPFFNPNGNECKVLIKLNDKYNVLTEDFRFLWNAPKEKWFTRIFQTNDGKYFVVINEEGKSNILTLEGNLALNKFVDYINPDGGLNTYTIAVDDKYNFIRNDDFSLVYNAPLDEWFDSVYTFRDGKKLTKVSKGPYDNFLNINGTLLFDDWIIIGTYEIGSCSIVNIENNLENIVDMVNGVLVSNQWFEKTEFVKNTSLIKCYVSEYEPTNLYYNYESGELKAINGRMAMHDFEANPIDGSVEEYIHRHFGEDCGVKTFIEGKLYKIIDYIHDGKEQIENLLSIEGGKPRFLLPKWVGRIGRPLGNVVSVNISASRCDEKNLFNLETESYVFNYLINAVDYERDEGIIYVYKEDTMNMVESNGNVVFEDWADNISPAELDNFYKVRYDYEYNMYDLNNHRFIANQNYDDIFFLKYPTSQVSNICAVSREKGQTNLNEYNEYNLLGKDGELMLNNWYHVISLKRYNSPMCAVVNLSGRDAKMNFVNANTGEFVSDEPFKLSNIFHVGKIKKNGKINFVNSFGDILLPQWFDSASNFDNRGYVTVTYGNENRLYKANDGKLELVEQEGNVKIPSDFTFCDRNQVDLINHILRYELIGCREGRSEHTTIYNQKVTVILKDGNNTSRSRIYAQRGDESCTWTMYGVYEALCKELGIEPASVE